MVLGVSPDSVKSHQKFKQKYELPFTLIADEGHKIAEMYGVWGEKVNYGLRYMGILRTTFLINENGRVEKVFEKVKPLGHAQEVAKAIETRKASS